MMQNEEYEESAYHRHENIEDETKLRWPQPHESMWKRSSNIAKEANSSRNPYRRYRTFPICRACEDAGNDARFAMHSSYDGAEMMGMGMGMGMGMAEDNIFEPCFHTPFSMIHTRHEDYESPPSRP